MPYTILELTEIPRERDRLRAIIGQARYQMRKSRMVRYTAYAIIAIAVMLLSLNACSRPHILIAPIAPTIYLPLVMR